MRWVWYCAALPAISLILTCRGPEGPEEELPDLTLDDIKREYSVVDSLNILVFQNELDTSKIDRYVVLGRDIWNGSIVVRRGEARMFGCISYDLVFGLFYENGDSSRCTQIGGTKIIDYEGFAGTPRYVGCAPDTSQGLMKKTDTRRDALTASSRSGPRHN